MTVSDLVAMGVDLLRRTKRFPVYATVGWLWIDGAYAGLSDPAALPESWFLELMNYSDDWAPEFSAAIGRAGQAFARLDEGRRAELLAWAEQMEAGAA